ncbi:tail tip assembly protein I [Serratia phage vB_SmaM-Susuwatari]|nr:tail tip assembly protein I [Serratia phage vB_SmaM-Susuwatari]
MALKTIRLYGRMGALFGRVHRLDVDSPKEAVKALCVREPGFRRYLLNAHQDGVEFAVLKGRQQLDAETIAHHSGSLEIRIAPIVKGSKRGGLFQTILGAAMIAVGIVLSPFTGGASLSLAWAGGAMVAGGIIQMLSPQPQGLKQREDPDNKPSYAFGGPVNSTAMGNPVAILWGEREIGGSIISAGIVAEDVRA